MPPQPADGMQGALLDAIQNILVCPNCKETFSIDSEPVSVLCHGCRHRYSFKNGILVLLEQQSLAQESERRFRDALAAEFFGTDHTTLLQVVAQHHCLSIMQELADQFYVAFKPCDWILDIGIGFGWHWANCGNGARIIGIDMSLGNLILAQKLLDSNNRHVALVCADASALPIRNQSMSGLWSVQTLQHLPEEVLETAFIELRRVLKEPFRIEMVNLNPALLVRIIYWIFGKQFQGKTGHLELKRLSPQEWVATWRCFHDGYQDISCGYSELFFHPDLGLRPRPYPARLERAIAKLAPSLAGLVARQGHVHIVSRGLS